MNRHILGGLKNWEMFGRAGNSLERVQLSFLGTQSLNAYEETIQLFDSLILSSAFVIGIKHVNYKAEQLRSKSTFAYGPTNFYIRSEPRKFANRRLPTT